MAKKNNTKKLYIFAVGRRREAVARVRLYNPSSGLVDVFDNHLKRGDVVVNGKNVSDYFTFPGGNTKLRKLLEATKIEGKYIVSVKVAGGGLSGQADALVHGVARALDKMDHDAFHSILKQNGYLTRDPRARERRKVGNAGKARRKKSSPKR